MTWTRRRPWNDYGAVRYSEDQPREENGRFGSGGGESAAHGVFGSSKEIDPTAVHSVADLTRIEAAGKLPKDTATTEYFYHAVRTPDELTAIAKEGVRPGTLGGQVFLSKDEVRDRGSGYAIVGVPVGSTKEGVDQVEPGLSYREFTTSSVSADNVVGIVKDVQSSDGVWHANESELAGLAASHQGAEVADLPPAYQPWFSVGAVRYSEDQPRDAHGRFGSGGGSDTAKAAPAGLGISTEMLGAAGSMTYSAWNREYGSTPGGQAYYAAVQSWTAADDYTIAKDVASGHPTTENGKAIAEALDNAPTIGTDLYRGLGSIDTKAILEATGRDSFMGGPNSLQAGDTFTLRPSSFSTDQTVARGFMSTATEEQTPPDSKGHSVDIMNNMMLDVQSGARGAPIQRLSSLASEREVISAGKFEVTGPPQTRILDTATVDKVQFVQQMAKIPVRQIQ